MKVKGSLTHSSIEVSAENGYTTPMRKSSKLDARGGGGGSDVNGAASEEEKQKREEETYLRYETGADPRGITKLGCDRIDRKIGKRLSTRSGNHQRRAECQHESVSDAPHTSHQPRIWHTHRKIFFRLTTTGSSPRHSVVRKSVSHQRRRRSLPRCDCEN